MERVAQIAWSQVREAHAYVYGGGALRRLKALANSIRQLIAAQQAMGAVVDEASERLYWTCQKELMNQVNACLEEVLSKIVFINQVRESLGALEAESGAEASAPRICGGLKPYGTEPESVCEVIRLILRSLN